MLTPRQRLGLQLRRMAEMHLDRKGPVRLRILSIRSIRFGESQPFASFLGREDTVPTCTSR